MSIIIVDGPDGIGKDAAIKHLTSRRIINSTKYEPHIAPHEEFVGSVNPKFLAHNVSALNEVLEREDTIILRHLITSVAYGILKEKIPITAARAIMQETITKAKSLCKGRPDIYLYITASIEKYQQFLHGRSEKVTEADQIYLANPGHALEIYDMAAEIVKNTEPIWPVVSIPNNGTVIDLQNAVTLALKERGLA